MKFVETADSLDLGESLPDFLARTARLTRRPMLINGLLPAVGIAMLHGQPRSGKSLAALEMAVAVATGSAAFGAASLQAVRPRRVWYVAAEDPEIALRDRIKALLAGHGRQAPNDVIVTAERGLDLDRERDQQRLCSFAVDHGVELTILDPLRALTGCVDQGPHELRPFAAFARSYVRTTGSALLLVHHDVKPAAFGTDRRARSHRASGGGIFSIADSPIHVEEIDERRSRIVPGSFKFLVPTEPFTIQMSVRSFEDVPTWIRLSAEPALQVAAEADDLESTIVDFVKRNPGKSGSEIARTLKRDKGTVLATLKAMHRRGILSSEPGPRHGARWYVASTIAGESS